MPDAEAERWLAILAAERLGLFSAVRPFFRTSEELFGEIRTAAHEKVSGLLLEAQLRGGMPTEAELKRVLPYVNATGGTRNCLENAMSVDDILKGRTRIARQSDANNRELAEELVTKRTLNTHTGRIPADFRRLEQYIHDLGPGAHGVIIRRPNRKEFIPSHTFNIANLDHNVRYLDAQAPEVALMVTERYPMHNTIYDFYRTG